MSSLSKATVTAAAAPPSIGLRGALASSCRPVWRNRRGSTRPEARGSSAGGHRSGMDGACMEESPGIHHRPEARSHRSGLGGASFGSISTESDVMSSTALEGISIIFFHFCFE